MTARRRFRIVVCLLVLACAIPLETILLQALAEQDAQKAVSSWVVGLSADELDGAVAAIESYPVLYRREMMRVLGPEGRSAAWRGYLKRFIERRPDLDENARGLLNAAIDLATPDFFAGRNPDGRARAAALGTQLSAIIGRDAAEDALHRLGPRDGTFASAEPVALRMANYVRGVMIALADEGGDCDCSVDFGCQSGGECKTGTGCTPDEEWPMCGWFWNDPCEGACKAIMN